MKVFVFTISSLLNSAFTPPAAAEGGFQHRGHNPAGGNNRNMESATTNIRKTIPRVRNVLNIPILAVRVSATFPVTNAAKPNPARVSPTASPLLSGNHLAVVVIGQP